MTENKYANGKIYKLTCEGLTYYGSSCNTLTKRLNSHKCKSNNAMSKLLFEKGSTVHIALVEDFPCDRKEQLNARERYYIENNECVNKIIPGRTPKEYKEDHKEKFQTYFKDLYQEKREERLLKQKVYDS